MHNWSEHRQQQKETEEFLNNVKEDLNNDISNMQTTMETLSKNITNFSYLQNLNKKKLDSIIKVKGPLGFHSGLVTTKFNDGDYEGFNPAEKLVISKTKT